MPGAVAIATIAAVSANNAAMAAREAQNRAECLAWMPSFDAAHNPSISAMRSYAECVGSVYGYADAMSSGDLLLCKAAVICFIAGLVGGFWYNTRSEGLLVGVVGGIMFALLAPLFVVGLPLAVWAAVSFLVS